MPPPASKYTHAISDGASTSDAEMLLGLQNSPYSHRAPTSSHHSYDHTSSQNLSHQDPRSNYDFGGGFGSAGGNSGAGWGMGDMMMESQEIDMSTIGGEMMPWLEYLPQDMLNFFDGGTGTAVGIGMEGRGG